MECRETALLMDDYLDQALRESSAQQIQQHLLGCEACRRCYDEAAALQAILRSLPAPAPRPGFIEEALRRRPARTGVSRRALAGAALAATIALSLGLAVLFGLQSQPAAVETVVLTVERPETVRLMFDSPRSLPSTTVSLTLPDHVELVGYGTRRELSWQTDLAAGANLLQLPLIARGAGAGQIVARLSHGANAKTFRLNIEAKPYPGGMS